MNGVMTHCMVAALPPETGLGPKVPGSGQDFLTVLIACAALGLVILGAMTFWLKGRKGHRHHHRRHHRSPAPEAGPAEPTEADAPEAARSHAHSRRRRRRAHRGRNPSLAETGGLPPPRPEGQVPPGL